MSTSLYQKHRPTTFSAVIGQNHIAQTLLHELQADAVAHAYLFSGPRGVGKTTSARLLARAINCSNRQDGEPDNTCDNCQTILSGKTLDVVEIDAASHTGVDNIRENIIESSRVAPSQLPWKVFIIDEVHMLSTSAFNALLKTLEEPPKNTLFILATTELHKVPETIVSRCERFGFHRVAPDKILSRLQELTQAEQREVAEDVLRMIAKRADGGMRDAESLLGQVLSISSDVIDAEAASVVLPRSQATDMVGLLQEIHSGDGTAALARVTRLQEEGVVLPIFLKEYIEFLRQVLLAVVSGSDQPITELYLDTDSEAALTTLRAELSLHRLSAVIRASMTALEEMKTASIEQLPLELAIVELVQTDNQPAAPQVSAPTSSAPVTAPVPEAPNPQPVATEPAAEPTPEPAPPESDAIVFEPITGEPPADSFHNRRIPDEPKSEAAEPEPVVAPGGEVSMEMVQKRWNDVLEAVRDRNHALHLTFKVGQLVSVEKNVLTMGFQYQFYQDRLNDAKNGDMIADALQQVFQANMQLQTVIGNEYTAEAMKNNPNVNIEEPSEEEVANVWELATTAFGEDGQPA